MVYSVQNSETGELLYIHDDRNCIQTQLLDEETGEPLNDTRVKVRYAKHQHFHIPKQYLRGTVCEEFEKSLTSPYDAEYPLPGIQVTTVIQNKSKHKKQHYNKEDFINMEGVKNEIILGYNKKSVYIFLIPTLFCFNILLALFLGIIELFLHFWAHKKNGLNMNKSYYFRSPLHILTSHFCAICRSESEMEIQIFTSLNKQMRKARESKTLKDVTKAIG